MLSYLIVLFALSTSMAYGQSQGVNWAVLIAGSNGYYNYRHQADVCHAYQIMHRNGIPDERIIVLMYDDIANSDENPFKGTIINRPKGEDVYHGVPKDYTGKDVTPENFLNVLKGLPNKDGKKVLKSGPNDNVFIYYADHGAPGLVGFPDGQVLNAKPINEAITYMHENKMYKNLVFYLEACESGSIFKDILAKDINVYATTAANSEESSYACYYDDARETYLGDLYSVNWMEDTDKQNPWTETLAKQFDIVKKLTTESHAQEFGNITMSKTMVIGDFQAEKSSNNLVIPMTYEVAPKTDAVKSEDVSISIVKKKLLAMYKSNSRDVELIGKLNTELVKLTNMKQTASKVVKKIASLLLNKDETLTHLLTNKKSTFTMENNECYMQSVERLYSKCFNSNNEYVMRNLYVLLNLCEHKLSTDRIASAIDKVCVRRFD